METVPSTQLYINSQMQQIGFRGPQEMMPQPPEAESPATLLIQHLPEAIPHDTLSRLLSHYGALSVRPCTSGRLRNCAFVDFKNEILASQALRHLNGLRFLGKVLSVERAGKPNTDNKSRLFEAQQEKESIPPNPLLEDVKSVAVPAQEPIAERLGVDYPFPPHLEYVYPSPDGSVLTNIVNALIAVPRFYVQVLHLMNKMNLPAPFRMALPTPPLPPSAPDLPPPPPPVLAVEPRLADLSSEESELDSSGEELDEKAYSINAPGLAKHRRKRARREAIVGPGVDKDVAHEAVGLKPATLIPKEIPMIKKKNPVLQIKIGSKDTQNEHKDYSLAKDLGEAVKESLDLTPFATPEELKGGKLPPEEILSLPMFKNYTIGNPASVLYVKNLAKDVVAEDFYYIFGSFFGSIDDAKSGLSVKLMQEGRMRGQAFVTFPSVDLAGQALNLVNGYVFKGKPMIVQFGRNPAAAKAT